ncbi:protein BCCIP homolog [Nilaparvata lugens]|uniref:protein BCCIP homolog n=1 Tax=Nilaparvata lugens TaxID=108931 RepID=UPI000B98C055|nr:protein BCCIP homolog [Nilaparvata lugens]
MSGSHKKRAVDVSVRDETSSDGLSDDNAMETQPHEEIQVDFEGRNPIDSDFHGIRQLLHQLFLKAHVNLSDLTNLIIEQNYIGSVIKQSEIDEDSGDDDDEVDPNDVYGVTSIINITDKQHYECVDQLRTLLREMCAEHGTDQSNAYVRAMLSDTNTVGLLINERFINFPAQIAVPLLESLVKEIQRAKEKKLNFNFSYIIIICKLYKEDATEKKKKKKGKNKNAEPEIIWTNPEEELFDQEADCRFEFSVRNESDSALSGDWMEDDRVLKPYRRVLVISADKLERIIDKIKDFVTPTK